MSMCLCACLYESYGPKIWEQFFLQMALDVLQWTNKSREDVNFVLEGKLMFTQATETSISRRPWNPKMAPVSALLVTLGRNSLEAPPRRTEVVSVWS